MILVATRFFNKKFPKQKLPDFNPAVFVYALGKNKIIIPLKSFSYSTLNNLFSTTVLLNLVLKK